MTLDALIMGAGALVALLPFLGFPQSWDKILFFLLGAFVIALGIVVRRQSGSLKSAQTLRRHGFEESRPPQASTVHGLRHEEAHE